MTALFPEVGTPFLLRVTALDYGGEAYSTDVWLVVGPAEVSTRDRAPVDGDPIEHGVVPGRDQVSPTCMGEARPIDQQRWVPMRVVLEATTCVYRVTWSGWDPPRTSEYRPDGAGWLIDYFISGSDQHGQVFWNVTTGEVRVRLRSGQELSPGAAPAIAAHAAATIFPGIDLDTLVFDPRPCPDDAPCTPYRARHQSRVRARSNIVGVLRRRPSCVKKEPAATSSERRYQIVRSTRRRIRRRR